MFPHLLKGFSALFLVGLISVVCTGVQFVDEFVVVAVASELSHFLCHSTMKRRCRTPESIVRLGHPWESATALPCRELRDGFHGTSTGDVEGRRGPEGTNGIHFTVVILVFHGQASWMNAYMSFGFSVFWWSRTTTDPFKALLRNASKRPFNFTNCFRNVPRGGTTTWRQCWKWSARA